MSKKSPQTDGSPQTTKQMLDELDALMERMLSLPVNDLEENPTAPALPPVLSAKLTLLESPTPPAPVYEAPAPSFVTPAPLVDKGAPHPNLNPPHFSQQVPLEPAPDYYAPPESAAPEPFTSAVAPEPFTNAVAPPPAAPELAPLLEEVATDEEAPIAASWGYVPLLWINQSFDAIVALIPGVGTTLCTSAGRAVLGLSGIAMTAAACGWLVKDWLGWNW